MKTLKWIRDMTKLNCIYNEFYKKKTHEKQSSNSEYREKTKKNITI